MNFRFQYLLITFASLAGSGCSEYHGVVSPSGADTAQVDYTPRPNPDALVMSVPTIEPLAEVEAPQIAPLPRDLIWEKSAPIAFSGDLQVPLEGTTGAVVSVVVSPIKSDGSRGEPRSKKVVAKCKPGAGVILYRIDWQAPPEAGRYHVAIQTVGPALDMANLETFAEGEAVVR